MEIVRKLRAVAIAGGIVALLLGTVTAQASARPLEREHVHILESEVITDCGLTMLQETDVIINRVFVAHGRDGLAYLLENFHGSSTLTNLDNGLSVTHAFNSVTKDLKVTDNGDGTLTILVLSTGSLKVFGPDGELLYNDPGQIRFEILIDHGGTPTDPSDDEFLEFLGDVFGSTGRNDLEGLEFCDVVVQAIG
ncbi:hypothetical protein [Actinophytocola sp.]|uniref:hypothetical protein n=1 Tax=Actinophytocola sp. TaxID=1872138 RepID=UPI002ED0A4DE